MTARCLTGRQRAATLTHQVYMYSMHMHNYVHVGEPHIYSYPGPTWGKRLFENVLSWPGCCWIVRCSETQRKRDWERTDFHLLSNSISMTGIPLHETLSHAQIPDKPLPLIASCQVHGIATCTWSPTLGKSPVSKLYKKMEWPIFVWDLWLSGLCTDYYSNPRSCMNSTLVSCPDHTPKREDVVWARDPGWNSHSLFYSLWFMNSYCLFDGWRGA